MSIRVNRGPIFLQVTAKQYPKSLQNRKKPISFTAYSIHVYLDLSCFSRQPVIHHKGKTTGSNCSGTVSDSDRITWTWLSETWGGAPKGARLTQPRVHLIWQDTVHVKRVVLVSGVRSKTERDSHLVRAPRLSAARPYLEQRDEVVVLVSGVRSKTSHLVAKLCAPVRAPRPYC